MRPLIPFLTFLAFVSAPSTMAIAQSPSSKRVTITPTFSILASSHLITHRETYDPASFERPPSDPSLEYRTLTRMSVESMPMAGVGLRVPVRTRWSVDVEGAYGTSNLDYRRARGWYGAKGFLYGESVNLEMEARAAVFAFALARRITPDAASIQVELGVGGALTHLELERPDCRPSASSFGSRCAPAFGVEGAPWKGVYNLPAASGTFSARWPLATRVEMQVRAVTSVGRVDTESFRVDLPPRFDRYEVPNRSTMHTTRLSLGSSVRL